ncbi:MAG: hypothetical protein CMC13_12520 [Flavobacteriaceae bacterium]|nr:hypothetical protein [Flavobacteriaceae bacterium]|tara:strand:- start:206774 stop:208627 length:1854 start_codon:yes stop_codon:yes gene_type:complete
MEVYILKSVACLGILFGFYKLVLENTSLHTTKRFYLLGSLLVSMLIPFITFTEYVEIAPLGSAMTEFPATHTDTTPNIAPINYVPYFIGIVYGLGVLIFSLRFGRNLLRIYRKVRYNPKFKSQSVFHVLLQLPMTPHSFFNYIFFNKTDYDSDTIPEEVIIHETAHATQKHSWDIVVIELLCIVFWFNPLIYFIKHSIKLNHEFLADRAVLKKGADTSTYQKILLDFSSPVNYRDSSLINLAHSINYSSTRLNGLFSKDAFGQVKKRFTVMKTHTTKRAAWLKTLLVLPLLAALVYGFSTSQVVEKASADAETAMEFPKVPTSVIEVQIHVNTTGGILVNENLTDIDNLENTLLTLGYNKVSPAKPTNLVAHMYASDEVSMETIFDISEVLQDFGLYKRINHSSAKETGLVQKNKPTSYNIKDEKLFVIMVQLSKITINGKSSSLKTFARDIDKLTKNWKETDYADTRPIIKIASTPNTFLQKLDAEYKKTHFSKANGGLGLLPPPPPPPPNPPKVLKGVNDGDSNVPPPPPAPNVIKGVNDGDTNIPPPPPPPKSPLDHVIEMAKKNATFYLEGEKISSDKAIEVIKSNNNLNIQTTGKSSKNPQVKISTKPVKIN